MSSIHSSRLWLRIQGSAQSITIPLILQHPDTQHRSPRSNLADAVRKFSQIKAVAAFLVRLITPRTPETNLFPDLKAGTTSMVYLAICSSTRALIFSSDISAILNLGFWTWIGTLGLWGALWCSSAILEAENSSLRRGLVWHGWWVSADRSKCSCGLFSFISMLSSFRIRPLSTIAWVLDSPLFVGITCGSDWILRLVSRGSIIVISSLFTYPLLPVVVVSAALGPFDPNTTTFFVFFLVYRAAHSASFLVQAAWFVALVAHVLWCRMHWSQIDDLWRGNILDLL